MTAADPAMGPFLWRYFRRYWLYLCGALVATLIFAFSTVSLLALFRPILSEVLRAEDKEMGTLGAALGTLSQDEEEEKKGVTEALGINLDLAESIDRVVEQVKALLDIGEEKVVWFFPLLFLLVFLSRSLADFVNGYLFQVIGLGATNDLRNDLYGHILHQSSRFYSDHPSGELVSRVGNDISVMQNAISNRLLDLFQQSVTLIFLIWYLLSAHLQLALICLVAVPLVVYPIVRFGQGMRRTSHRSQERLADLSNLVAEAVRGHRVVKAFGMEGFELGRFREATARHLKVRLKAQLLAHSAGPVVESTAAILSTAFLIYAGYAVRSGDLTAPQLVQFLTNLIMLYDPVRKLNKVNLILQESLAAAQRVARLMAIPKDVQEAPDAQPIATIGGSIRFDRVTFAYDENTVLRNVSLEIPRGRTVALVGSSGAGKSTLVNLLPRFFDPEEGSVEIDGVDLRRMTLRSLREQIGIVTQDTVLFNDTIHNNIAYGRSDLPFDKVVAAARAAFADEFIRDQPGGYDAVIGEGGLKLSGGQRQRIAIARALLKDPPILILDEATSHLDSQSEALVQQALVNLMQGRTALVIAHRLSTVMRVDHIVVMEAGTIVEEGTHAELLAQGGVYRRLHDLQFRDF